MVAGMLMSRFEWEVKVGVFGFCTLVTWVSTKRDYEEGFTKRDCDVAVHEEREEIRLSTKRFEERFEEIYVAVHEERLEPSTLSERHLTKCLHRRVMLLLFGKCQHQLAL